SNPGSARGLRVKDCNKAPAQAKAAPTSAPMIMRGSRSCLMTKIACSSASGSLINACHSTFSERKGDTGPAPTLRLIKQQDRISSPTKLPRCTGADTERRTVSLYSPSVSARYHPEWHAPPVALQHCSKAGHRQQLRGCC